MAEVAFSETSNRAVDTQIIKDIMILGQRQLGHLRVASVIVPRVTGHYGATVKVGRKNEAVVLQPFDHVFCFLFATHKVLPHKIGEVPVEICPSRVVPVT